jgi:hypothetical protein
LSKSARCTLPCCRRSNWRLTNWPREVAALLDLGDCNLRRL